MSSKDIQQEGPPGDVDSRDYDGGFIPRIFDTVGRCLVLSSLTPMNCLLVTPLLCSFHSHF
jgi:hypothetical protein